MKILFFGLGSIGLRHARIIQRYYNHDLFAYRTKKGQEKNNLQIKEIYDFNEVFKIDPDIAFITNPTYLHIDTAIKCAENGIDLFIEKPLSNSLENIEKLKGIVKNKNLFVYIGQCMRFHPVIRYLREIVDVDNVIYSKTIATSYLPNWRPNQDYRKSFSVDSKKGGGVLLELIHEIDYNHWLFGKITEISGEYGSLSNLESGSEDFAELFVKHRNGLVGNIHLNWFAYNNERKIKIYCNDGYIEGDLLENYVLVKDKSDDIRKKKFSIRRDDIYKEQLDYFFNCYDRRKDCMNTLFEATDILKLIVQFKKDSLPINANKNILER